MIFKINMDNLNMCAMKDRKKKNTIQSDLNVALLFLSEQHVMITDYDAHLIYCFHF